MKKNLTVYKASAGSGKTFTLAVEYIKLLIENPENYKHILAVTFTNKATGEMKSRILSQLFGISRGLKSSEGYVNALKDESRLGNRFSDQTIKDNASTALTKILHDYSNFNVTTIDAFFQKIMRNMARELGLPANTSVDLDHNKIETLAVDRILDEMTPNDEEYNIVNGFVNEKIDDNKSWNVTKDIKDFGNQIFSSSYRAKEDEVKDAGREQIKWNESGKWSEYTKKLKAEREAAVRKIKSYGERYRQIISEDEKVALGKNVEGMFEKFLKEENFKDIKKTTYFKCLENTEELLKAAYRSNSTMMDKARELQKILEDFENDTESTETINSVDLTLKHLSSFRLLNVIREKINGITEENNISLLSDTQDLLSQLLTEGDATFIYEKTGSYISHIMIDEFQDTSETQWKNFKILIDECISHGTALIVGDVKQSIYRWRGGDWRLLSGIGKKEYEESTRSVTLDSNYRSEKNIIDFNNSFFKKAEETARESIDGVSDEMKSELENAYKDVEQKSPKTESRGEIVVTFKGEGEDVNDEIANRIITLIGKGAEQRDIAIIVRKNKQINDFAQYLEERKRKDEKLKDVSLVSAEAYKLENSLAVRTIVSALDYIATPEDRTKKAVLAKNYATTTKSGAIEKRAEMVDKSIINRETHKVEVIDHDINKLLPKEIVEKHDELARLPIHELIERIYKIMEIDKIESEGEYISKFIDTADSLFDSYDYTIKDLISDWNDKSSKNSISQTTIENDEAEGVRILTVHKSKGLEYDHVIVPVAGMYGKGKGRKSDSLWCVPSGEPFNEIPLAAIDKVQKMQESIYRSDYDTEAMMETVDNLNTMYVAFTRAGKNLYLIGKRSNLKTKKGEEKNTAETFIKKVVGINDEGNDTDDLTYSEGEFCPSGKKSKSKESNPLDMDKESKNVKFRSNAASVHIWQSGKSKDFVNSENAEADDNAVNIKTGTILHRLFSEIKTDKDISRVLDQFEFDGILDTKITRESVERMLKKRMESPTVKEWFSDKWELFNECAILSVDEKGEVKNRRPDRVMKSGDEMIVVDFKFARKRDEYHEQVKEYISLLQSMGYKNVKGYLWYVFSNDIEEVA